MSAELAATIICWVIVALTFFGCCAWMIRRFDANFERMGDRIDGIGTRIGEQLENGHGERLERFERGLIEVRVALARIEGPRSR